MTYEEIEDAIQQLQSGQVDANLNPLRSQLNFPLDPTSVKLIRQLYPFGTATLAAGTVTVSDNRVKLSSTIMLSRSTTGGTLGHLSLASQANGSFIINSSSSTDTSKVNYLILS